MITACSPNEVSVVQLRRPRSAQEISSMLSANMASSSVNSLLLLWTPVLIAIALSAQEKKAAQSRGLLELPGHSRCPLFRYLGGSLGFGVVGFGAAPTGGFAAGLVAPAGAAGAGTPDFTL